MLISKGSVFFGIKLRLGAFSDLLNAHHAKFSRTPEIEDQGQQLIAENFPKDRVREFVQEVCSWGNYPGIAGRVLKHNSVTDIRNGLIAACARLAENPPKLGPALASVNALKHLGTTPFASKHLRLLRPDLCPVFDSLLHNALPYPLNQAGYRLFAADCGELAEALEESGVPNPRKRPNNSWFVADVESALYAHVTRLR